MLMYTIREMVLQDIKFMGKPYIFIFIGLILCSVYFGEEASGGIRCGQSL